MEGTIGEIRLFAGNFNPINWQFCNGQLLSIVNYTPLFSILGTTYGGDGLVTFGVPDLRGRIAVGTGTGAGLTNKNLGDLAGTELVTLSVSNLPAHTHPMMASSDAASAGVHTGNSVGNNPRGGITPFATGATNQVAMGSNTGSAGSGTSVNTMQPHLGMNYILCTDGIYPSRN